MTAATLTLKVGSKSRRVLSLAMASHVYRSIAEKWEREHPEGQNGSYAFPKTGVVESGAHRYHVSYNGKVWVNAESWTKGTEELLYSPYDPFQNDFRAAHEQMVAMRDGTLDPMSLVVEAPREIRATVRG